MPHIRLGDTLIHSGLIGTVTAVYYKAGILYHRKGAKTYAFLSDDDDVGVRVGDEVKFDLYLIYNVGSKEDHYIAKSVQVLQQGSTANNKYEASGSNVGQDKSPGREGAVGGQSKDIKQDTNQSAKPRELSRSAKQREEGNGYYKSATADDVGPEVRINKFNNAIACYKDALSFRNTIDEEVSAMKNIGMASWKLAAVTLESTATGDKDTIILKHFKEALKHFYKAFELKSCKSEIWGDKLEQSRDDCFERGAEWLAFCTMNTTERIAGFSELLGYVPDCKLKANGYIKFSTLLFHLGVVALEEGDYKKCKWYMEECHFPIEEAARLSEDDSLIKSEVKILEEDVKLQTCIAESIMKRTIGDDLIDDLLKNHETLDIDKVWIVIDFYKESVLLCRDKELEQEAIAYSRLGRVYGKVLGLKSRGKDYYKRAIELALSMIPKYFHDVGWYKESTKFVEDFQKRVNKDEVETNDKKVALEEMKEDVQKLTKMAEKIDEEFLKELYKAWPPKTPVGAKLNDNISIKNKILKAVCHYHPDKVDKEVHGKNWFFFSQEITKHLNVKYSSYKNKK